MYTYIYRERKISGCPDLVVGHEATPTPPPKKTRQLATVLPANQLAFTGQRLVSHLSEN